MPNITEITDFSAPELDIYARLTEVQLLNREFPEKGMFIAESPKVIERALDAGYEPVSVLVEKKHVEGEAKEVLARLEDVPVFAAEFDVLKELTGFPLTRGLLCAMKRKPLLEQLSLFLKFLLKPELRFFLQNLQAEQISVSQNIRYIEMRGNSNHPDIPELRK